jgi:hypothetical protein
MNLVFELRGCPHTPPCSLVFDDAGQAKQASGPCLGLRGNRPIRRERPTGERDR